MIYYFITTTITILNTDFHEATHFVIGTTKKDVGKSFLIDEAYDSLQQLGKTGKDHAAVTTSAPLEMPPGTPDPDFPPIRDAADIKTWIVDGLAEMKAP
jgi:hypothetical protein